MLRNSGRGFLQAARLNHWFGKIDTLSNRFCYFKSTRTLAKDTRVPNAKSKHHAKAFTEVKRQQTGKVSSRRNSLTKSKHGQKSKHLKNPSTNTEESKLPTRSIAVKGVSPRFDIPLLDKVEFSLDKVDSKLRRKMIKLMNAMECEQGPELMNRNKSLLIVALKLKSISTRRGRKISLSSNTIQQLKPLDIKLIPCLAHNLDRVLFSPGVHYYQDPRTRVYNFSPYLKRIIKYQDFDFDAIAAFQSVSKDKSLLQLCKENNRKFYSSTSSMTSTLMQFYNLLNNYDPSHTERFEFKFRGIMSSLPSSILIVPKGCNSKGEMIYAVEQDKSADTEILLSAMGHCLEALLTTGEKDFDKYRKDLPRRDQKIPAEAINTYNYAMIGDFVMRSQLDCYDQRLPGNGTFDLKTRAALSVRYDSNNPSVENNHYQIWRQEGQYESFEREYRDMVDTGAMLKYAMQARIGQMDGIYVAYHNVNTFFGFQYLPLSEIDKIYYSHKCLDDAKEYLVCNNGILELKDLNLDAMPENIPSFVANAQFSLLMQIWQDLLRRIVTPNNETKRHTGPFRLVLKSEFSAKLKQTRILAFTQRLTPEQLNELQTFPKKFKTSFREKISILERNLNLQKHRNELNAYNRKLVEMSPITAYSIHIHGHQIGNTTEIVTSAYPKNVVDAWKIRYLIVKRKCQGIHHKYLELLRVATDSLFRPETTEVSDKSRESYKTHAQEAREARELYKKIGTLRRLKWLKKDNNPVMYQPISIISTPNSQQVQ